MEEPLEAPVEAPQAPRKQNIIARLVNDWFDRVVGEIRSGGLSKAEARYAPHKTTRDFIWNSAGNAAWAFVFPIVTMVSTQLVGVETAGMIAMAFVIAILLMFVGNFGVRTYQISDIDQEHSFKDYQANRWVTCIAMVGIGWGYCQLRGYTGEMLDICMGVILYKLIDALADVYEGRLQQVDKLYLAGISQALRSVAALVAFCLLLLITRSAPIACYGMAIVAAVTFVAVTWPLTLMEAPTSKRFSMRSFLRLFKSCAPLFLAIFCFNVIENMPKFIMEDALPYDYQLYYNAMYFPAQMILILAQLVYKPLLLNMAGVWQRSSKRGKFNLILIGMVLVIAAITALCCLVMLWFGIDVLSFLYGIDFHQFRGLIILMLITGGIVSAVDFLYQVITIMRRQKDVTVLYLVTLGFSFFIPFLLIHYAELEGAVLSYVFIEVILFVLLVWEYFRIRFSLRGKDVTLADEEEAEDVAPMQTDDRTGRSFVELLDPAEAGVDDDATLEEVPEEPDEEPKRQRPSQIRAERERREEVMRRRTRRR